MFGGGGGTIAQPLSRVACHIVAAERANAKRVGSNRLRANVAEIGAQFSGPAFVSPRRNPAAIAQRCPPPLLGRGQILARPARIGAGFVPGDAYDSMIGLAIGLT